MPGMFRLDGLNAVQRNLDREVRKIKNRSFNATELAGLFLEGEAGVITLHDEGNLVNSLFHRTYESHDGPTSVVWYEAEYAAHAHELPEGVNVTTPGTEVAFLQKAAERNKDEILRILAGEVKIG
jgi:hypothetical protein